LERLAGALGLLDLEDVEADSLGERTALTNGHDITTMRIKTRHGLELEIKGLVGRHLTNYLHPFISFIIIIVTISILPPFLSSSDILQTKKECLLTAG
jgi:hypothetical protein